MISARVFSQLEFICRNLRGNDCVFGGLQVIVGGDFRQLKPVPNNAYRDPGDYCFLSDAWNCALRHVVVLDTVIRQREPVLITAIQELATRNLSPSSVSFLKSLARPLPDTCKPTYLYARNYDVMMTCYDFLCEIPGEEKSYHAVDDGELKKLSNVHVPKVLVMKKGCKVMLTVNLSTALVNGSIGTLIEMGQDHCTVNFNDVGPALIKPYCFTVFSQELGRNVASRTQLPLKLAYAITIVVVVFYWPLGSKQISRSIYIHITHTKHGKKLTSAHQSNKEINIASVSVDFVWYNRDFFYISIAQNFMKRASPVLALGPRKFPGTGANSRPARPSGTRSVTVDRHMRKYRNGQQ